MKNSLKIACLLSLVILTVLGNSMFLLASGAGAGNSTDSIDVKPQPLVTSKRDGTKLLRQLTARVKQLGSYKFEGQLVTCKDKGLKIDSGKFYYMPESCIRVEVKGKGFKAGSVVVKQKNGAIRAQGGPALLGMKMNLQADSNMLMLANGLNIVDCDYLSLLNWLQAQIASGQKVYASDGPLLVQPYNTRVLVLETIEAGLPDGSNLAHRILIDPQKFVPVEWDIFKKGQFFSTVKFRNFESCPSFDESLFHI